MVRLANRSTILISKAVENAAERNAKLFERAVQIIKNATKVRPDMNSTELVKLLKGEYIVVTKAYFKGT